jgi:hypothetical protein
MLHLNFILYKSSAHNPVFFMLNQIQKDLRLREGDVDEGIAGMLTNPENIRTPQRVELLVTV